MRADMLAYIIYLRGPDADFLPELVYDPQIPEYVR